MTWDKPIKVVVVDNHPLALMGISCALSSGGSYLTVGSSGDANKVLALVDEISPHLLIIDRQNIPGDVLGAIRHVTKVTPSMKTIVFSEDPGFDAIMEAFICVAIAFIRKEAPISALLSGIESALSGQMYIPEDYASKFGEIESLLKAVSVELSNREMDILEHLMNGKTNKEIANLIGRDENTVGHNLTALMTKLGVRNRLGTARAARIWAVRR